MFYFVFLRKIYLSSYNFFLYYKYEIKIYNKTKNYNFNYQDHFYHHYQIEKIIIEILFS